MNEIEIGVLEACQEYASRQCEMLPQLAAALSVEESQVFYTWGFRQCAQTGSLADTDWAYFFHGLECNLLNQKDGRSLRMDFGPKGRVGILDSHGVLCLILTSLPPWREFPELRSYFAKTGRSFEEYSRMSQIWNRLESKGCFEQADPTLVALEAKYSTRGPDGLTYVRFPSEITDQTQLDCYVAHRQQLTPYAVQLLRTRVQHGIVPVESTVAAGPDGEPVRTALK